MGLKGVLLAAALTLVLPGGAGARADAPAAGPPAWTAEAAPFRLTFTAGGAPLVAQAAGGGASSAGRMAYALADGTRHMLTHVLSQEEIEGVTVYTVATDEPGRTARVAVRALPTGIRVEWQLEPEAGVAEVFEALAGAAPVERFLGTGQRGEYVELTSEIVQLKVLQPCGSSIVAPFYVSSAGYGVRFDTTAVGHIQFHGPHDGTECDPGLVGSHGLCKLASAFDRVQACFRAPRLAYEVYAGDPAEVVSAHARAVGLPELPAPAQFALVKWRDEYAGAAQVREDVRELKRRGIPIGWVLIDNPWEHRRCFGTLAFDDRRFPDPRGLVRDVRRRGVRVMLWVSPYVTVAPHCSAPGYADRALIGTGRVRSIDLTDPEARAEYVRRLKVVLALGVDGVKGDRGDEADLEGKSFAAGPGTQTHNAYPALFANAVAEALASRGRSTAMMFRGGLAASGAFRPPVWAGDQTSTFGGLRSAVRSGLTAGVSGFPYWGSDVGGYIRDSPLTAELFVRWSQLAAVSPLFEVGGPDVGGTFWKLGRPAVDGLRRSAILHYELFPYLYELAREAARSGVPILRPLALEHPDDARAWEQELELLVGRDLLAAPVTSPGGAVSVYLPAGEWVDVFTGERVEGPRTIRRIVPLERFPLYLRAGTTIPFNARLPIWRRPWRVDDLARPGRAGYLVAPGGERVRVQLRGAPREAQAVVLARRAPVRVRIGGRVVPRSTLRQLQGRAQGWAFAPGAFGGVVLKLAPRAGRAVAVVELSAGS